MADIDTTQLNKSLSTLIPNIKTQGDRSVVGSSNLQQGVKDLISSLQSFGQKSGKSSEETTGGETVTRDNTSSRDDNFRSDQESLIETLNIDEPDSDKIFDANRRRAQGSIDLIESERDRLISEDIEEGRVLGKRGRSLSVAGGLGGSDFASSSAQKIEETTSKVIQSRRVEAQAQIQSVLDGVATRSSEQFQADRATFLTTAKDRLDLIEEFNTNLRTQAKADIESLVTNGLTLEEFKASEPDTFNQLLEDVGGSEELLNSMFASAVPADQILFEDTVNGRFIQVIQDPVTGERRQQTFDLGEDFRTEGLKLITKTAGGQLVFGPDTLTDTSELQIYGAVGQFGGDKDGDDKVVFSFDKEGKGGLVDAGFSGKDITEIESDIEEFGLPSVLEGMDEEQQAIVRSAVKEPVEAETVLDRAGIAGFLNIEDPEDETPGADKGGLLGFGATPGSSPKDRVDAIEALIESYRALNLPDSEISKILIDRKEEARQEAKE